MIYNLLFGRAEQGVKKERILRHVKLVGYKVSV